LRPSLDVLSVDIRNFGRVSEIEFVEAVIMLHAVGMQKRAHRTVSDEGVGEESKEKNLFMLAPWCKWSSALPVIFGKLVTK
jgi:hypothetical protein